MHKLRPLLLHSLALTLSLIPTALCSASEREGERASEGLADPTLKEAGGESGAEAQPLRPWEFGALPLLNYSSQNGFGYGAYGAVFHRKERPRLGRPYEFTIGAQYYATTGGFQFHMVNLDVPSLPNGIRLRFYGALESWTRAVYLGQGEQLVIDARRPEEDYRYQLEGAWLVPTLRVPLTGPLSLFQRITSRWAALKADPGSLLDQLQPDGVSGGRLLQLELGLLWDARDTEPCTRSGFSSELSLRGGHARLGSTEDNWGWNLTHRHWWSPWSRLVIATRVAFDQQGGWVPLFQQHILGGSAPTEIGGSQAMRGFENGRFRGRKSLYGNLELRTKLTDFELYERGVELDLVPFVDWGRFWDAPHPPVSSSEPLAQAAEGSPLLQLGFGVGPRIIVEEIFVLRFELAWGIEQRRRGPEGPLETFLSRQFYAIANHPF